MKRILMVVGGLAVVVLVVVGIGMGLPSGHVAAVTVQYEQPAERIFAAILRVEDYPTWRTGLKSVVVISGPGEPLRWRETGDDEPIVFRAEELDPPTRFVALIDDAGLPFGGRWVYEVAPRGDGSELRITEIGEVYNPVFRLIARIAMDPHATMEQYTRDLGRLMGQDVEPVRVDRSDLERR